MNIELEKISELLNDYQVDLHSFDSTFIQKTIVKRMEANGLQSSGEYYSLLQKKEKEVDELKDSLYIHYSEFFRNSLTFAYLEQHLLPELIRKKRSEGKNEIRIWSVACAEGQEAYSIAILFDEYNSTIENKISYRIFASDISLTAIENAKKGIYTHEQLGNITLKRFQNYFKKENEVIKILPIFKKNISFSYFDLLSDKILCPIESIYGDFDLIFCCNILFYYNEENRQIILNKIKNCIAENGYLITGETEKEIVKKAEFNNGFSSTAIFQQNNKY